MKKHPIKQGESIPRLLKMLLVFVLLASVTSCSKQTAVLPVYNGIYALANILQGEIINGPVSTETDDDGLALWCNNNQTLIGIGKRQSQQLADPGSIEHAQVIYSTAGIIVRDTDTDRYWYYIQDDSKSASRFQLLQPLRPVATVSGITGTIKINISKTS